MYFFQWFYDIKLYLNNNIQKKMYLHENVLKLERILKKCRSTILPCRRNLQPTQNPTNVHVLSLITIINHLVNKNYIRDKSLILWR